MKGGASLFQLDYELESANDLFETFKESEESDTSRIWGGDGLEHI